MKGRRACVIGAYGALGRAVTASLRTAGWSVRPAGRQQRGRDGSVYVDLDQPATLGRALDGADLIVSTVPHYGFAAERRVLEHGGLLVNCSHAPAAMAGALNAEAPDRRRGTVMLNGGLVPGVANLVAAELLETHPEADTLAVAFTVNRKATAGRSGGEFVHSGLASRSHHDVIDLSLPNPFGELTFIEIHEHEDCGFAGVAAGRHVKNYLSPEDRSAVWSLRAANALRLMRLLPKAAFTMTGGKGEPSREPMAIWIGAKRERAVLGASLVRCEGDYRVTAAAARMFGEALIASRRPGCFNPEDLFTIAGLAKPLEEMGVRFGPAGH
jgi:hypothetical protein